jgi:hypothetical protein
LGGRVRRVSPLLDALDIGKVDAVITQHTDRLHRSLRELEEYVDLCERRKVVAQAVEAGELDQRPGSSPVEVAPIHRPGVPLNRLTPIGIHMGVRALPLGTAPSAHAPQVPDQRERLIKFVAREYQAGRSLRELGELTSRTQAATRRALDTAGVARRGSGAPPMTP